MSHMTNDNDRPESNDWDENAIYEIKQILSEASSLSPSPALMIEVALIALKEALMKDGVELEVALAMISKELELMKGPQSQE